MARLVTAYTYYFGSNSNTPLSSGDYRYYFTVDETVNNNANTSTITTRAYVQAVNNYTPMATNSFIKINGIQQSTKSGSAPANGTKLIGTWTNTINHNSDGTGSFSFQGTGWVSDYGTKSTSSYNLILTTIPRAPTINSVSATNISYDRATLSGTVDTKGLAITSSVWDISTDGGNTWSGHNASIYGYVLTGLQPNTNYWYRGYIATAGGDARTAWWNFKTLPVNTITSTNLNAYNDTEFNVTASVINGSTNSIKLSLPDLGIDNLFRKDDVTSLTYTIQELEEIARLITNVNSTKLRISAITVINGVDTYTTYKDGLFSIRNAKPVLDLDDIDYYDNDSKTTSLTGNDKVFIKNYSQMKLEITPGALDTKLNAAGKTLTFSNGSKTRSYDYNSQYQTQEFFGILETNITIIRGIDSRDNYDLKTIEHNFIDYKIPVYLKEEVKRVTNISKDVNLKVEGTFDNIDFGAVQNTIKIKHQFREVDTVEWSELITDKVLTIDENNWSFDGNIEGDLGAEGFSTDKSFEIRYVINDELHSFERTLILLSANFNIVVHKNGAVSFGGTLEEAKLWIKDGNMYVRETGNIIIVDENDNEIPLFIDV